MKHILGKKTKSHISKSSINKSKSKRPRTNSIEEASKLPNAFILTKSFNELKDEQKRNNDKHEEEPTTNYENETSLTENMHDGEIKHELNRDHGLNFGGKSRKKVRLSKKNKKSKSRTKTMHR